jgi:hypothetical protein
VALILSRPLLGEYIEVAVVSCPLTSSPSCNSSITLHYPPSCTLLCNRATVRRNNLYGDSAWVFPALSPTCYLHTTTIEFRQPLVVFKQMFTWVQWVSDPYQLEFPLLLACPCAAASTMYILVHPLMYLQWVTCEIIHNQHTNTLCNNCSGLLGSDRSNLLKYGNTKYIYSPLFSSEKLIRNFPEQLRYKFGTTARHNCQSINQVRNR